MKQQEVIVAVNRMSEQQRDKKEGLLRPYSLNPEVGKAQLKAQSTTSATSAIAEVALRFNFLF